MTKTVKLILVIAFVIFVAGVSWAVIAKKKHADVVSNSSTQKVTQADAKTPSTIAEDKNKEVAVAESTESTKSTAPAKKAATKQYQTVVTYEYVWEETSSSAWAEAGTDANGNTYAEAHAE